MPGIVAWLLMATMHGQGDGVEIPIDDIPVTLLLR